MSDDLILPGNTDFSIRELVIPADSWSFRSDGDGRFMEGFIVPWMKPTDVVERRADGFIKFREQFAKGSFDRAIRAPRRVTLQYGHNDSLTERLGSGESFRESEDGLVATFRLDSTRAEQAKDVIETSHSALSAGFISLFPTAGMERDGEFITRKSVHLGHVAVVPAGAYPDARVLAMRAEADGDPTEAEKAEAERIEREKELLEWVDQATEQQRELERPSV